jgi:hypothetical protein
VSVLFLTRVTLDGRILTDWLYSSESWPYLISNIFPFVTQRDAEGKDNWPKRVELRVTRLNEATQSSSLNLGAQGATVSYLPFHYLQRGWPEFIVLTTRERPISEE